MFTFIDYYLIIGCILVLWSLFFRENWNNALSDIWKMYKSPTFEVIVIVAILLVVIAWPILLIKQILDQ
jgi:hypothetical protein